MLYRRLFRIVHQQQQRWTSAAKSSQPPQSKGEEGIHQTKSVTEDIKKMAKDAAEQTRETIGDAFKATKELFTGHGKSMPKEGDLSSNKVAGKVDRLNEEAVPAVDKEQLIKTGNDLKKEEEEKNQM